MLGGLCLVVSAAYARALGARGGRVAAIVLLLAAGIAGTVAGDRGLDFSLVWLPLELLALTKARTDPRWLFLLPPLCLLWVNTHGSILLGLAVLGVELGWSLIPERLIGRVGGLRQSPHTGSLALALLGSLIASCITPYGPGLLAYDFGVSRNGQIAQYISEWSSPNFHSVMTLLVYCVPLAVLVACVWTRRIPLLEGTLGVLLFVEALQTQRLAVYLLVVAVGLAATLPARAPWGTTARRWAGGGLVALAIVILAIPAVPAGSVASSQPVAAFDYLSSHPGPDLHAVHLGRLLGGAPPGHLRRRAHGPLRGSRPHRVHRRHEPHDEPRPRAVRLRRLLRRVGPRHAARAVPRA